MELCGNVLQPYLSNGPEVSTYVMFAYTTSLDGRLLQAPK